LTPSDQGASKRLIDSGPYRERRINGAISKPFVDPVGGRFGLSELVVKGAAQASEEASVARLARLLLEFERMLRDDPPDRVVLADDSDEALAAALVATKLPIPLDVTASTRAPTSANGRLIAQLVAG
jgi:hypothetical protein